jgi:hypothetical protein
VQIVAGVLHVDKSGVEARQPDDLDDLRVGDPANMSTQSEPALAQYPLDAILFHASLPRKGKHIGGWRTYAITIGVLPLSAML